MMKKQYVKPSLELTELVTFDCLSSSIPIDEDVDNCHLTDDFLGDDFDFDD